MAKRLIFLLLAIVSGAAFAGTTAESIWLSANRALIDQYAIPRYEQLAKASSALEAQGVSFCRSPDESGLEGLRQTYHQTMDAWMGAQTIRFGPVDLFLRYTRFELWPDPHGTGGRQINKALAEAKTDQLAPERFRYTSVAIQGLNALERLLYGDDVETPLRDFGTPTTPAFRCHLVEAIGHNIAAMSREIMDEWTTGETPYRAVLLGAEQGNGSFDSSREVTARFLNNLYATLQMILDQKLMPPLGSSADKADVRRAESWRSRRSLNNILLDLQAAESLYTTGFSPVLMNTGKASVDAETRERFRAAIAAAQAIDQPLEEAINTAAGRTRLEVLLAAVSVLKHEIGTGLPAALALPVGFNALDGD